MAAFKGIGTALGLGVESVYGTAVARTNWIELSGVSGAGISKNYVESPTLPDQATRKVPVSTRTEWSRTVRFPLTYAGLGLVWYYATGLTPVDTGANPYTHVFELSSTMPTSLTAEVKLGDATNSETAEGVKIDKLTISGSSDAYLTVSADLIGETSTSAAVGTPAYATTRNEGAAWHAGELNWNSGTYCLNAIDVTIERNHTRPTMMGCAREPVNGYAKVSGRLTVEYDGEDWYSAHRAETVDDADITFTSGAESFKLDLENLTIKSVTRDVSDGGRILQVVEFECYGDGTKTGLKITSVNAQATYALN